MSLLSNIVFGPVSGPLKGLLWLARVVNEQADNALYDEGALLAALMALEQRLEAGEIDETDYEAEERVLLERLKISRGRTQKRR